MQFNRNPFVKISKILSLIALMSVALSCSKDDEPEPNIENASLSLTENTQVLEVPAALLQSDDGHAGMVAEMINMANSMSASLALFNPPAGATQTSEVITPANGRTAATRALVYKWSDNTQGISIAYQIQDVSDKYVFELFYKEADDAGWYRYLYAEEMKDRSAGYMAMYDAWGTASETRDAELFRWEWSRQKDNFSFSMSVDESVYFTATINTKTKAGSMQFYDGEVMYSEVTWTAQGSGTWKQFDSEGNVVESGEWS